MPFAENCPGYSGGHWDLATNPMSLIDEVAMGKQLGSGQLPNP